MDVELRVAAASGDVRAHQELTELRDALVGAQRSARKRFERDHRRLLAEASRPNRAPDYLDAMVMRHVAGVSFGEGLIRLLDSLGLRPDAVDLPKADFWGWLAVHDGVKDRELPLEVRRLRQLSGADFVSAALNDIKQTCYDESLAHVAVAERWELYAEEIRNKLQRDQELVETELRNHASPSEKKRLFAQLRKLGQQYARASARCLEAELVVDNLQLKAAQVRREESFQRLRARCLGEAARAVGSEDPTLYGLVAEACEEHRITCAKSRRPHPCADCAGEIARTVRGRMDVRVLSLRVEGIGDRSLNAVSAQGEGLSAVMGAVDLGDAPRTIWESRAVDVPKGRGGIGWRVPLRGLHIEEGWCPVPDSDLNDGLRGEILQLRIYHDDGQHSFNPEPHGVELRYSDRWELHGVRWPDHLISGTVLSVRWQVDRSVVTIRTKLLKVSECVEGVKFDHEYDARVLTREHLPEVDEGEARHSPAVQGWVMRTVRKLGYLSPDGTATMPGVALRSNCVAQGMPKSLLGEIGPSVSELVGRKKLRQVLGSLDQTGVPSAPPRAGEHRVQMLQYIPLVEKVLTPRPKEKHMARPESKEHRVAGHTRKLPAGRKPSAEQLALREEACRAAGVVEQPLPDGTTFVRPHLRGKGKRSGEYSNRRR
ncbi:hypothetical protein [Micromonospora sp. WMMD714]|uniref:hypothetical protein n=1 Tax=Micromonospora sp. WMMD714 TaxID=3016097 RepID=UPI00249A21A0|nr:hypothetical protein [Micromonospora sp. WMMD714]WFE65948.1 hypothetical protein O7625_22875 [Micromonospora sp. WMMD714]